jgi:predicted alpha/beta-fold hydrolase
LELPDGDFLDLDWTTGTAGPVIVVLHGLEGSSRSRYATGLLHAIHKRNWRGVVVHFRGCSGEPNRLLRRYHAGDTSDLQVVVDTLRQREPETRLCAVGYSLGGNVLLKWLAEAGRASSMVAAVAVSVPFLLNRSVDRLERGFSHLYQRVLLKSTHAAVAEKHKTITSPVDLKELFKKKNFRAFDDGYTAPVHGFRGADDYYRQSSCRQFLYRIQTPTMILHALDDPFLTPDAVPQEQELSSSVTLELSPRGGHVGFVSGRWPWKPSYWLEHRIPAYFDEMLTNGAQTRSRRQTA